MFRHVWIENSTHGLCTPLQIRGERNEDYSGYSQCIRSPRRLALPCTFRFYLHNHVPTAPTAFDQESWGWRSMIIPKCLDKYVLLCLRRPILVVSINCLALLALATLTVLTGQLETVAYGGAEWLVRSDVSTRDGLAHRVSLLQLPSGGMPSVITAQNRKGSNRYQLIQSHSFIAQVRTYLFPALWRACER